MKRTPVMLKKILPFFISGLLSLNLQAQDSISVKDAGEISYRAELVINEYRDLLNIIANAQTEIKETKDLILNSYGSSKNRIFFDSSILIENDLDPSVRNSQSSKDLSVAAYLNNLDLFYSKSDTSTIHFSNIRVSNIKQGEYLYVKVYFTSEFRGKNTLSNGEYAENNRVAEIRISRQGTKWTGAIMNVGFYGGGDIAADTTNDIKLSYAAADLNAAEASPSGNGVMTASYNTVEESLKEKERQKQVAAFNQEKRAYDLLIEQGDQFFKANDFASASKAFSEAQELKPYEIYPKLKLAQIRKQAEQSALSSAELFNQFISKAQIAESARRYEQAKEFYMKAFSQKPEEAEKYREKLKVLNNKIRILSELSEKYITGLYKEAIKSYDAAIKKDNANSDYYLGRAKCYDKLGDNSRALKDYSKSIDLDNNNLEALQLRADLYKRQNDFFKAMTDYKMYLTVDKFNLDIYAELSDLHVLTNNVKAALEDLDNGLQVNNKAAFMYHKKGIIYHRSQSWPAAVENYTTSIQLDSSNVLNYYYRGECYLSTNRVESAAQDFEIARQRNLDSMRIRNIAAYAAGYSQRAATFHAGGRLDSAIKQISHAIMITPEHAPYRFARGEYFFDQKNFGDAINNYDKAIGLNPAYEEAFYKRGLAYFNQLNYSMANESFLKAIELYPNDFMALKGSGDSYFNMEQYAEAARMLESCLRVINATKARPGADLLAFVYNELGKSYNKTGNYAQGIENCRAALKQNRDYGEAYFNRGFGYYRSGDLSSAVEDMAKALTYANHVEWSHTLADVYKLKGEFPSAIVHYNNAIANDSVGLAGNAFYGRGYSFTQVQNWTAALPDYLKTIELELDSAQPGFSNELGRIYLQVAKYDSALLWFQKTIAKNAADQQALYGIASTYYLQNKMDDALTWFETLFKQGGFNFSSIKKDKLIAPIRDDKRFKALQKKYD
jgi:tetratricopeptide (TPR) repeat protein